MRVLVTGGAGYIGSVCTAELLAANHEVVVVDNLSTGFAACVPSGASLHVADVCDLVGLSRVFEANAPFDAIMHFASWSIISESMIHPQLYLRDNLAGMCNLITCARRWGVDKVILSSTASVYGEPTEFPAHEGLPYAPTNPYGQSKVFMEQALHWAERVYGIRSVCLRYMNACGASLEHGECHDPETHLIPNILKVALGQRERLTLFGDDYPTPDGTCIRDYVHVVDIADAHIRSLEALDDRSMTFNIGTGRGTSVLELVEAARRVTGHPIPLEVAARRQGDPPVLYASVDRIRQELGWQATYTDIDEIIASAWQWHRRHPDGIMCRATASTRAKGRAVGAVHDGG